MYIKHLSYTPHGVFDSDLSQETGLPICKAYGRTPHSIDYFFLEALDESMRKCKAKGESRDVKLFWLSLLTFGKK